MLSFLKEKEEKDVIEGEGALKKYVTKKDSLLESDVITRLYGTRTQSGTGYRRAGYNILRQFYDGDQWTSPKEGGGTVRTYNYIQTTVYNYTAFLAAESPEVDIPPDDITDEIEVARAEEVELLIRDILEENQFPIIFEEAVQNGSLLGDSMIIGPFWDKNEKRIWFENVKRPELVRIIWSNTSYTKMEGFIYHYNMLTELAESTFSEQMKARDIKTLANEVPKSVASGSGKISEDTENEMTTIKQYWSDTEMLLMVGDRILDYVKHDWGFIPLLYVKNISHPVSPWGISDVENKLDAQQEFNEGNSFISDILRNDAAPHIFGKNVNLAEYKSGVAQIHDVGEEGEILPNPFRAASAPVETFMSSVFKSMIQLSGENEVIYGGSTVREATGRALSVLMQSVNNRVRMREKRWRVALQLLVAGILRLIELYVPDGKILIQGKYKSDIFFPGSILRNVTEEINKFNAKLQSMYTTMKNIGIPSPTREKKLMKSELSDMQLSAEISRNPQLQLEFSQMVQQMVQQQMQAQGGKPMLREDQNQGEEQPMSAGGFPSATTTSQTGAVAQAAQNAGAASVEEGEE